MSQMLEGVRVIECASGVAAPTACALLADMGAEVIKVEDPGAQDRVRRKSRQRAVEGEGVGPDLAAEANHHSKKGIVLDLKKPGGRSALHDLIAKADVFCTNYPPRVISGLRLDHATLSGINSRLVYGLLTSYGSKGPDAEMRGADPTAQARSGIMFAMGDRDTKEPVLMNGALFDQVAGITLAMGMLAALSGRARTGKGDLVETSLLAAALYASSSNINSQLLRGRTSARHSRTRARNALANFYQCADGKWLILSEPNPDRYWLPLVDAMGVQQLKDDPRFATIPSRRENYRELLAVFEEAFKSRSRDEWFETFQSARLNFVYAAVNDYPDVVKDPQVHSNGYVVPESLPGVGTINLVAPPIRFGSAPMTLPRPSPALGQHTEEVLRGVAGYGDQELARLRAEGVIG